MILDSIRVDWNPAALGNLRLRLYRQPEGGAPVLLQTMVPTNIGRHQVTLAALNHTLFDTNAYYLEAAFLVAAGSILNQIRIGHRQDRY
jgi:hypothetical protein